MNADQEKSARGDQDRQPASRPLRGLDWLNFFLADVRDGLGPYLAIYLIAVRGADGGWNEATTGLVMSIAGVAGLIAQTPAGALIDRSSHKRAVVITGAVAVTLSCLTLPFISNFYLVAATQSVAGIAGAIFPPALAAITLGAAFLTLAAIAVAGLALYYVAMPDTLGFRPSRTKPIGGSQPAPAAVPTPAE